MRPRPLRSERAPAIIELLTNVNTKTPHTRWAMTALRLGRLPAASRRCATGSRRRRGAAGRGSPRAGRSRSRSARPSGRSARGARRTGVVPDRASIGPQRGNAGHGRLVDRCVRDAAAMVPCRRVPRQGCSGRGVPAGAGAPGVATILPSAGDLPLTVGEIDPPPVGPTGPTTTAPRLRPDRLAASRARSFGSSRNRRNASREPRRVAGRHEDRVDPVAELFGQCSGASRDHREAGREVLGELQRRVVERALRRREHEPDVHRGEVARELAMVDRAGAHDLHSGSPRELLDSPALGTVADQEQASSFSHAGAPRRPARARGSGGSSRPSRRRTARRARAAPALPRRSCRRANNSVSTPVGVITTRRSSTPSRTTSATTAFDPQATTSAGRNGVRSPTCSIHCPIPVGARPTAAPATRAARARTHRRERRSDASRRPAGVEQLVALPDAREVVALATDRRRAPGTPCAPASSRESFSGGLRRDGNHRRQPGAAGEVRLVSEARPRASLAVIAPDGVTIHARRARVPSRSSIPRCSRTRRLGPACPVVSVRQDEDRAAIRTHVRHGIRCRRVAQS